MTCRAGARPNRLLCLCVGRTVYLPLERFPSPFLPTSVCRPASSSASPSPLLSPPLPSPPLSCLMPASLTAGGNCQKHADSLIGSLAWPDPCLETLVLSLHLRVRPPQHEVVPPVREDGLGAVLSTAARSLQAEESAGKGGLPTHRPCHQQPEETAEEVAPAAVGLPPGTSAAADVSLPRRPGFRLSVVRALAYQQLGSRKVWQGTSTCSQIAVLFLGSRLLFTTPAWAEEG